MTIRKTACFCLVILGGCDSRPDPADVLPDFPTVIANFQSAKNNAESTASCAKAKLFQRHFGPAKKLYAEAQAANNAAIAYIEAVLQSPASSFQESELRQRLANADSTRQAFLKWFEKPENTDGAQVCHAVGAIGALIDAANVVVELLKLQDARAAERRNSISRQLESCKWRAWADIPADR